MFVPFHLAQGPWASRETSSVFMWISSFFLLFFNSWIVIPLFQVYHILFLNRRTCELFPLRLLLVMLYDCVCASLWVDIFSCFLGRWSEWDAGSCGKLTYNLWRNCEMVSQIVCPWGRFPLGNLIDYSKWVGRCFSRQSLLVWQALLHPALTTVQTVIRAPRVTSSLPGCPLVVPLHTSLHVVRGKPFTFSPMLNESSIMEPGQAP